MGYKVFRKIVSMEEYFSTWDSENYARLNAELKERIYEKYLIKAEVFQRDEFTCQNDECKYPDAPLTLHHVKWQKNGGKDSARNCLTVCNTCHQGFHRGKRKLVVKDRDSLPNHMRGMTFTINKDDSINWKKVKTEMKSLRKRLHNERVYLTMKDLALLMRFLETIYDYESGDD